MVTFILVNKQSKDLFVPLIQLSLRGTIHIHGAKLFPFSFPAPKKQSKTQNGLIHAAY